MSFNNIKQKLKEFSIDAKIDPSIKIQMNNSKRLK